jgi:hypothetical protein
MSEMLYQNFTNLFWGYLTIAILIEYNGFNQDIELRNQMLYRVQNALVGGLPYAFFALSVLVGAEPGPYSKMHKNGIMITALVSLIVVGFVNDNEETSVRLRAVRDRVATPLLIGSFAAVPIVLASGFY